jgi:cyclase
MLKHRLIPILLLKNGQLVRSEGFKTHQIIGDPIHEVRRFNEWSVDELIYIDITRTGEYDARRSDHKSVGFSDPLATLDIVSESCFMPLTWGGRIRTLDDVRSRIARGADKVTLNSSLIDAPEVITLAARRFGSQAVVVSIDALRHPDGRYECFVGNGAIPTGLTPTALARRAEDLGAGEILVQSIDRDGAGRGYDLQLINDVVSATKIPVIACSGVGRFEHYADGIRAGASAVAAANIWHFKELADLAGKRALRKANINVRH